MDGAKRRRMTKRPENGGEAVTQESCTHEMVLKDLCAICGKRLHRAEDGESAGDGEGEEALRVSMIHHVPELMVSEKVCGIFKILDFLKNGRL